MVNENKNITKVCSFYVSEWHLITMLLPHINKTINERNKVTTILEDDAQEKVEILLNKIKIENANNIININWRKKDVSNIKIEELELEETEDIDNEIIIAGSIEYINEANDLIEDYVKNNDFKGRIKIINCYLAEENLNIKEILNDHRAVLNTAGERTTKEFMKSINMVK